MLRTGVASSAGVAEFLRTVADSRIVVVGVHKLKYVNSGISARFAHQSAGTDKQAGAGADKQERQQAEQGQKQAEQERQRAEQRLAGAIRRLHGLGQNVEAIAAALAVDVEQVRRMLST